MTSFALASSRCLAVDVPSDSSLYKAGKGSPSGAVFAFQRLAGDPVATFVLTLTNVVVGSSIRVEEQVSGLLIEQQTAASTTVSLSLPVYSTGSAKNDLRIKVRKGSAAPKYIPFETLVVAFSGSQSVYIAQIPDPIA